jgi:aminoglycoside phosphotransferase (APT) family kinase protein
MGNANTKTRTTVTDEKDLVPLPFYASPETLPEKLPSCEEIEAASSSETLLVDTSSRKVVRVRKFIVKYGVQIDFLEGQTLLFLQRNRSRLPSLTIPRVYAMFNKGRDNYIIMECLEGWSTLHNVWQELTTREKLSVAKNLAQAIKEMRMLPSPTGGYCSVGPCPIPDTFFWKPPDQKQISGPFQTEEEWNRAMIEAISSDGERPFRSEFLGRSITSVLKGHSPVFTHGDLQRKNIMITKTVNPLDHNSFEIKVSLVDWEFAGWYPSYWEYYSAMLSCPMDDDWVNYVDTTILDPYYNEWYVCRTLSTEVFGY